MIDYLDHLILTTANESACVDFYTLIQGMKLESFIVLSSDEYGFIHDEVKGKASRRLTSTYKGHLSSHDSHIQNIAL